MATVVLVDGSNVAHSRTWKSAASSSAASDHELRRRLVDAICGWAAREGVLVEVAFDGAGPWDPGTVRMSDRVQVTGSGAGSGDALIERRAAELRRAGATHWVVTDDAAVRTVAGARAERVIDVRTFVGGLIDQGTGWQGAAPAARSGVGSAPDPASQPTRLADTLDDSARAKLERLRRGL